MMDLDGVNEYMVQKGRIPGRRRRCEDGQPNAKPHARPAWGEGFFILRMSGMGQLMLNSFGAIHKIELKPNEEYIVDNSHLVAWSSTTTYNIEKARSGWIASLTSGEGLVCRFRGPASYISRVVILVVLGIGYVSSFPSPNEVKGRRWLMNSPNALCFGEEFPATGVPCQVEVSPSGLKVRFQEDVRGLDQLSLPFSTVSVTAGGLDHDQLVVRWGLTPQIQTLYLKDPAVIRAFRSAARPI